MTLSFFPLVFEIRVSAERAGGAAERKNTGVIDPYFAGFAGIGIGFLAELPRGSATLSLDLSNLALLALLRLGSPAFLLSHRVGSC